MLVFESNGEGTKKAGPSADGFHAVEGGGGIEEDGAELGYGDFQREG